LVRALAGGDARAYAVPLEQISTETPEELLGERHCAGNPHTISGTLLALTGLFGKQIRRNAAGVKRSLSFRDVARLALVDEERIITERSPALTGQHTAVTEEKSTFGLFLTGADDAAVVAQETSRDRRQRLESEIRVLQELLEARQPRLESFNVDVASLPAQRRQIGEQVRTASTVLATRQGELNQVAGRRDDAWTELQGTESRRLFLAEQVKRLELLERHYGSDSARLESALEAGELFERLPQGACPVCGRMPENEEHEEDTDLRLREFQEACRRELEKIAALSRGLRVGLDQMRAEEQELSVRNASLQAALDQSNQEMSGLLAGKVRATEAELAELLQREKRLAEAAFTAEEVADLQRRIATAEQSLSARVPRPKLAKKVEAAGVAEFCEVVARTLRSWRFPISGNVSWSDNRFDLIIGDENRGSLGKGYRAVAYAAFSISLLRYCRMKKLPHPGLVMLDTPLNPYRGPDKVDTEGVNVEVQEAFYADLAADQSDDQVIVFENTEPPLNLRTAMAYQHFSGTAGAGRRGFFP
jgi:hypothetical protein